MSSPSDTAAFYQEELSRACKECAEIALPAWTVGESSQGTSSAAARLTTAEGEQMTVVLDIEGYQVRQEGSIALERFETLDDLLRSVSPFFEHQRMAMLTERLAKVADERRDKPDEH